MKADKSIEWEDNLNAGMKDTGTTTVQRETQTQEKVIRKPAKKNRTWSAKGVFSDEFGENQDGTENHDQTGKHEDNEELAILSLMWLRLSQLLETLVNTYLGLLHVVVDAVN